MYETPAYLMPQNSILIVDILRNNPNIYLDNIADAELIFTITFEGLTNPVSTRPAGDVYVTTYYLHYQVDTTKTPYGTFTPTRGFITGGGVTVSNPTTAATDSTYGLPFTPSSRVPVGGYIFVYIPTQLILRHTDPTDSDVFSGGVCTTPGFDCDALIRNVYIYESDLMMYLNPLQTDPGNLNWLVGVPEDCDGSRAG